VTSACSGAGSGWHGKGQIADSTVYLGGLATGGADPLLCANSWAVTVWQTRIASVAWLRRSRRYRAERGLSVGPAPLWMHSRPSWRPARAGLIGARSCTILAAGSRVGRTAVELLINRPVACSPLNRPVACSPINRPVACSPSAGGAGAGSVPGHHRLGCCRPGGRAVPGLGAPDLR
jgi:hypothetical protein